MQHMTKREAIQAFCEHITPLERDQYSCRETALWEAWVDWTHSLALEGHPTASSWDYPFSL